MDATEALAELQERMQALELERSEERSEVERLLQERDQVVAATIAEKELAIAKAVQDAAKERDQIVAATIAAAIAEKDAEKEKAIARAVQEAVQIERLAAVYVNVVTNVTNNHLVTVILFAHLISPSQRARKETARRVRFESELSAVLPLIYSFVSN